MSALLSPSPLAIPFRDTLRLPKRSLLSPETRLAAPHERIIPVPLLIRQHSLYRRPWHFLPSLRFTASVKPSTPLYFSLIGQHDISKRSSSLPPIFLFPAFLIPFHQRHPLRMETNDNRYLPSIIDGNQLQSMETNPSCLSFF